MKTLIETLCDAYDIVDRDCYPPEVCAELAPAAELISKAIVMVEDQQRCYRPLVVPALIVVVILSGIVAAIALVVKL